MNDIDIMYTEKVIFVSYNNSTCVDSMYLLVIHGRVIAVFIAGMKYYFITNCESLPY